MRRLRLIALAVCAFLSTFSAIAQFLADPRLTIQSGSTDLLALVANSSGKTGLLRFLSSSLGRPADGAPVAISGTEPTQCAASKSVAIHPNGRFVYMTSDVGTPGSVCGYAFDAQTLQLTPVQGSPFQAGRGTRSIAIDATGKFVYATNFDDGSISGYWIDTATGELTPLPGSAYVAADDSTRYVVVDPLGRFVYSTNSAANGTVSGFAIDRETGNLTPVPKSPLTTPAFPGALAIDPRGKYLYVAAIPNQVYSIDATTGQLIATGATFGPFAQGMAFDPLGRYLYTSSGTGADSRLNGYRIGASGAPTAIDGGVPTGRYPLGVAVSRSGRHVYTANSLDGNVSGFRIDDTTGALTPIEGSPFAGSNSMSDLATAGALASNETWQTGEPLARPIVAYGGQPPYSWAITGALPPGLAFVTDIAVVAGTPTTPGTYPFTARVTDAFGGSVTRDYTFTVKSDVAPPGSVKVVEFYNASLDHYFITWVFDEIAKLDDGTIKGWVRTGKTFNTYTTAQSGLSPICRYYIPPALGDSHFFGRGTAECNATGAANPSFVLENSTFMQMILPTAGTCPATTTQVYRVFSNRTDANHRYMTDRAVRDSMVAKGWLAEGDGPDLVVMCAP